MRPIEIGLVDTTGAVDLGKLAEVAAALEVQITQHLPKCWRTAPAAVVRVLTDAKNIPPGVWPIKLVDELKEKEKGFHLTDHYQPYAKVVVKPGSDDWTIDASHEALEMLIDPTGNMLRTAFATRHAGKTFSDGRNDVQYLVEICDPCEDERFAYRIGNVRVSDFVTPDFYADEARPNTRYSYTGNVKAPRQILPGGYMTWVQPASFEIEQLRWLDVDGEPELKKFGKLAVTSLRQSVDSATRLDRGKAGPLDPRTQALLDKHPDKFGIQQDHQTRLTHYPKEHSVIYYQDGVIEREIHEGSATPKVVREEVKAYKPIRRPAGTRHRVRNVGPGLLLGGKGL